VASDTTDPDGFYCFIDGVNAVLSGGITYSVKCTPPSQYVTPPAQSVIAQKDQAVTVNFVVRESTSL
jgi:hypothetical protein